MRDPFRPHSHRKPSRLRKLAGVAVFSCAAAAVATAVMLATAQPSPPDVIPAGGVQFTQTTAYTTTVPSTPANAAACSDVEWFRHIDRTRALHDNEHLRNAADEATRDAARKASPALHRAIDVYLDEDRGYVAVVRICQADVVYGV